jgi:hypothetical protein
MNHCHEPPCDTTGTLNDDLSGSAAIETENLRMQLIPPLPATHYLKEPWEEHLIRETNNRIQRRSYIFYVTLFFTITVFAAFIGFIGWINLYPHLITHYSTLFLPALLAIVLAGFIYSLIKLTSEPKKDKSVFTSQDELIKVGNNLLDMATELVKKKAG